jgi:hypothetical protein
MMVLRVFERTYNVYTKQLGLERGENEFVHGWACSTNIAMMEKLTITIDKSIAMMEKLTIIIYKNRA